MLLRACEGRVLGLRIRITLAQIVSLLYLHNSVAERIRIRMFHTFRPPESGYISQRYGSESGTGSGSFYHQAKIVRKHWFLLFCDFCVIFIFEKLVYLQKSNKQKTWTSWRSLTKIAGAASGSGSGSISQRYGSADPDPYQNFIEP